MIDPTFLIPLGSSSGDSAADLLSGLRRDLARLEQDSATWIRRLRFLAERIDETHQLSLAAQAGPHPGDDLKRVLVGAIDGLNLALASVVDKARHTASWAALHPMPGEPSPHAVWHELDPGAPQPQDPAASSDGE